MARIKYFVLAAAAAFVFPSLDAPAGNAPANSTNVANTAAGPAAAAPTKPALMALEKSSFEAWK